MPLRVFHIVRDLDLASGGPSRSIPALATSQAQDSGAEVCVLFQDRGNAWVTLPENNVQFEALGNRKNFSKLLALPEGEAILHLHGLWSPVIHHAARFAVNRKQPYVVSTRGMLADWALGHKAWKKKLGWKLYQQRDLEQASCVIASSKFEQLDIEVLLPGAKIVTIPNGCDAPPVGLAAKRLLPGAKGVRWALAMGRLHPVKGYADLIQAWAALKPRDWSLAIGGPDENGYRSVLESLIKEHSLENVVHLLGPVDDKQKWSYLKQCELFLAPSKTENFGMAIAEAMQAGCPVITTRGTPWQELNEYKGGWWIDSGQTMLESALHEATQTSAKKLEEMGLRGHMLITEKYSWKQVAATTIELYQSILHAKT